MMCQSSGNAPFIDANALYALIGNPLYSERAIRHLRNVFDYACLVMSFRYDIRANEYLGRETYQTETERIDATRTLKHDSAIASLGALNKMAERSGNAGGWVFVGDLYDRKAVAHAIFEFCGSTLDAEDSFKER